MAEVVFAGGLPAEGRRLVEVARARGSRAELVEEAADIDPAWLEGVARVGVTAGASAPERLVEQVIERLRALGCAGVEEVATALERVVFSLPAELRDRTPPTPA